MQGYFHGTGRLSLYDERPYFVLTGGSTLLRAPIAPQHNKSTMKVIIEFGRLKFRVDLELSYKKVFVRGHFRFTGRRISYVRPHYRRR